MKPLTAAIAPSHTIFDEDWWLEAAAPGAWGRVKTLWDGQVVGEMAFHVRKRWGLTYIQMPHLTRTMSPRLSPPPAKQATRELHYLEIVGELLKSLPRHDRFERSLNPGCPSVPGFVHANLPVTHMFTFRSQPGDEPEGMLKAAHQEARRAITKAQRECATDRSMDLDRFIRLHRQAYGEASLVDYGVLQRLFEAAAAREQVEIIFATLDTAGGKRRDTAAMIVIWDQQAAYTWLLARDGVKNYVGASSLLTFEAMRTAQRLGRVLDLDGYIRPEVGAFLMKFGLQPVVRPYVNSSSRTWQIMRAATTLARQNRPDRHFRVT
ncbi:MAG TPA: GNAT family N-acetyltransferase [Hyphomonadaceae bacterium]|nr:GNAT family N-acetyltransferase [Hyphomonadaceae bacterium]